MLALMNDPADFYWGRSGVFIVNFEPVSHLLVFLLLTLNM